MVYKTGDTYNYIKKWYIDYFKNQGLNTPFSQNPDNVKKTIEEVHNIKEYALQPHQKFVAAHMSNQTDFCSMMVFHGLGSGKTPTAITAGEFTKGDIIENGLMDTRKGSEIYQKNIGGTGYTINNSLSKTTNQSISRRSQRFSRKWKNKIMYSSLRICRK
jgi:hypothetical protein